MVTVPIWSKLLENRPPRVLHVEKTWSLLIMETTVDMWQLAYTHMHTHLKGGLVLKCSFYHFGLCNYYFLPQWSCSFLSAVHMVEIPLIRTNVLCADLSICVLAFRWWDAASAHASSWPPAPTTTVKFPLLLRGLRSHCASVCLCAWKCACRR